MCFCPTRARPGELPGSRISKKQRHGSPRWCLCWSSSWASKERWPCAEGNVFRVTRQGLTSWTQWERETASMPDFSHSTYKGRICKPVLHRETWQVPFQPRWLEARRRFGIESVGRSFGGNAATSCWLSHRVAHVFVIPTPRSGGGICDAKTRAGARSCGKKASSAVSASNQKDFRH